MRRSVVMTFGVALLALAVFVGGCGGSDGASVGSSGPSSAGPASRSVAPDFDGTTLAGTEVSLESYRGKPLVLIFWASW